jgi:hypothetical protein
MREQPMHAFATPPRRQDPAPVPAPAQPAGAVAAPAPQAPLPARAGARALPLTGVLARAVLQRQEDGPLDATQVARAIRFYTLQPQRYTPEIVAEIQVAVGVEPGGVADEETVQAVAIWQGSDGASSPALAVDGMAGPRSLPRLFAHGLNGPGAGQAFGESAQTDVIDRWPQLTPNERAAGLVKLVNVSLEAAGVPPVTPNPKTMNDAGQFDFETWGMDIGIPALSIAQPTRAQAADVVDTIYHEARHAEQWFRMAQLRAMQGRSAAQIRKEMTIQLTIAQAAFDAPLEAGSMQALVAQGWFDSVYGVDSDHRDRTLKELDAADAALRAARAAYKQHPTPVSDAARGRARARYVKAVAAYKGLPEENDAWATGPMTDPGVTRGAPEPSAGADTPAPATTTPATPITPPAPGETPLPGPTELEPVQAALRELVGVAAEPG